MHVLIIPDKFKGTLTAEAAARAIARGWRKARPGDKLDLLPMSDGGDGFGAINSHLLKAKTQTVKTLDAAHRPCVAKWWWAPVTKTAIIESATVIGLTMLPRRKFHPFDLDTFGLAALLRAAASTGARRCLIGIGGSATNDGGFGLARGLDWQFLNHNGHNIEQWTGLRELCEIRPPRRRRLFRELIVAVDVKNPLLGSRGATRVYGPQKGIAPREFAMAEQALSQLAHVERRMFGRDFARKPGAGAAGGLGFGLLAFAGAELRPGIEEFARHANLAHYLRSADLVITGEGAIDDSTMMGKGAGQIARRCRELKLPCIGIAGAVAPGLKRRGLFSQVYSLTELTTLSEALTKPLVWLERLSRKAARDV